MDNLKRLNGFEGEKLISLPDPVWKKAIRENPFLSNLYVTHIGYFPKAAHHYCERKNGCVDNILIYCLKGRGWYILNNKQYEVSQNEFVIIPATKEYLAYGADEEDPWSIYWVHFTGKDIGKFNKLFEVEKLKEPRSIIFNEKGLQIWNTMYESLEMGYSKENLNNTNFCLYNLLATFLFPDKHLESGKEKPKDVIHDTIRYMQEHLEKMLTIQDMAEKSGLSSSHFSSIFRKATGMSPLDYFIHLKIQKACLLLYSTEIKINRIAQAVGYDDPYYFSRLFKKYMSVSPVAYRVSRRRR